MTYTCKTLPPAAGVLALLFPLVACAVGVAEAQSRKGTDVDIRTPVGSLSVHTEVDARETGLPVYPGARPAREHDNHESANLTIDTEWFGLKVVAAKFESDDAPPRVLDFYRKKMRTYGHVTECWGDVEFRGRKGAKQPVCVDKPSSTDVELVTGTEERQRVVAVKPHGEGSEFSLVYVKTRGDD